MMTIVKSFSCPLSRSPGASFRSSLPGAEAFGGGWRFLLVMLALVFAVVLPATSATAQDGLDSTGSNFRIWGEIGFNGKIGPDDEVVQVAGGWRHTVAVLADGSVAC